MRNVGGGAYDLVTTVPDRKYQNCCVILEQLVIEVWDHHSKNRCVITPKTSALIRKLSTTCMDE